MPSNLVAKVLEAKNLIGLAVVTVGVVTAGVKVVKVPAMIEAHAMRSDSMLIAQNETNRILGQLLCITAKLDTPARCGYRK